MAVESQVVVTPTPSSASKSEEDARLEAAAEEFLAQVVDYEYPLPSPIDSVPADLFGGELGDYELHEIPSLFNLDSHQMSADLENLGLAAASGSDISFDANNESTATDDAESDTATTLVTDTSHSRSAKKRSAAEISDEDEDSSLSSSPPPKTKAKTNRRVTRSAFATSPPIKPLEAPSAVTPNGRKLLAPKPLSPRRVSTTSVSTSNPIANNGTVTVQDGRTINTSTAHVKALTGTKGAAMCFESVSGTDLDTTIAIPNLASTDLSPDEKAQFSRDRNRLHAKNTRIRKKAYVDELKMTLDVLVKERDSAMAAKNRKAHIEMEERQVRYSVVEEFLKLRGLNEQSPARWSAILEETVTLRLPNLDWKSKGRTAATVDGEGPSKKIVTGVTEVMNECNDFSKQLKKGSKRTAVGSLVFQCDSDSLLMEGANVVMDWTASCADESKSLTVRGTCRASFNPQSNKLHAVELFFDSSPLFARNM